MLESTRRQANEDFRTFLDKHMAISCAQRRERLFKRFKERSSTDVHSSLRSSANIARKDSSQTDKLRSTVQKRSTITGNFDDLASPGLPPFTWTAKEQSYYQAMTSLNEHRTKNQPIAICTLMAQLVSTLSSDIPTHQLSDSWRILDSLLKNGQHNANRDVASHPPRPRLYANARASVTSDAPALSKQIVQSSRKFLEEQFFSLLEKEIARNPHDARLGGVPSAESKIKAFVNIRLRRNGQWSQSNLEIINGVPMWAILFYLVRSGLISEALRYSSINEAYLSKVEKNWLVYIQAYASSATRTLPRQLSDRMNVEFSQRFRHGIDNVDPYKFALYKIIGRCELQKKASPEVLTVVEDWMWYQLCLVQVPEGDRDTGALERFSLLDLQQLIVKFGPRHFSPKSANQLVYFQILLLSGQYAVAIQFIAQTYWTDAVHFAAILSYYGLLRVEQAPGSSGCLLCKAEDSQERVQLDLSAMLFVYSRNIRAYSTVASIEYLALMCISKVDTAQKSKISSLCHDALREVVLESRDFATLLGDVRPDGTRELGFIEKRLGLLDIDSETDYLRIVAEHAAAYSEQEGRLADAILLYHLAEQYNTVVAIVNQALADALMDLDTNFGAEISGESNVSGLSSPVSMARNMQSIYSKNASLQSQVDINNRATCDSLLKIADCRTHFQAGNKRACLADLEQTGLVPLAPDLSIAAIKRLSYEFNQLDHNLARVIPSLLLTAIECLKSVYMEFGDSAYKEPSHSSRMAAVKRQAKNITLYAGLIRYNMDDKMTSWIMSSIANSNF